MTNENIQNVFWDYEQWCKDELAPFDWDQDKSFHLRSNYNFMYDNQGKRLRSEVSVEGIASGAEWTEGIKKTSTVAVIMESRGGGRNTDYIPALKILLERIRENKLTIKSIHLDPLQGPNWRVEVERRRVEIDGYTYPLKPSDFSAETFANALMNRMKDVLSKSSKGGNPTRRIRIELDDLRNLTIHDSLRLLVDAGHDDDLNELKTMSFEVDGNIGHIRFTRAEAANAVNPKFCSELKEVMSLIKDNEDIQAVAVTAEGKVFCAGGDLKEFKAAGKELPGVVEAMLEDLHDAIYMMNDIPKPFVAGIQGAAGGAGMSLVSAFDLVVSGESAKYTMAYTRVGLTPDGTSSYFLARHIGLRRMMDLTLTNRVLSAEEAESWGLVNRVVPDEDIEVQALKLAQQLADGAPSAAGTAKCVIYKGYESNLREAGDFEAMNIVRAAGTRVGQEGIAAFVEKRDPEWNE